MWNNIKAFFSSVVGVLIAGLAAVVGILAIVLKLKDAKLVELQTQINLAGTQKDADLIETKINQEASQASSNSKELDTLAQAAALLEEKRQQIAGNTTVPSSKDAVDYWNKN